MLPSPADDLANIYLIPLIFSAIESPIATTNDCCVFACAPPIVIFAEPALCDFCIMEETPFCMAAVRVASLYFSLNSCIGVRPFLLAMIGLAFASMRYFTIR